MWLNISENQSPSWIYPLFLHPLDKSAIRLTCHEWTLQALEALRIRDSAANPFIASARGNLLVQGNQSVDIFALNHPQSGLFSGEEMVLRSANPVGGDAHFGSGGNFRIEKLDGSFGGLFSPNASAIRANGDVAFAFYEGASLHILAGGSVTIPGYVWIQGTDPVNGIVENVTLSDGTIVSINSRLQPTLDIRAGTTALGTPLSNTRTPTSADIDIGTIFFADAAGNPVAGTVLLTNQYQSNLSLNGNIQISATQEGLLTGIASRTRDFESGGLVAIDSKGGITVNGRILASAAPVPSPNPDFPPYFYLGNGGDVTLLANGDINFPPGSGILSDGLLGGNITLKSDGTISLNGAGITSRSFSTEPDSKGGKIDIAANSFSLTGGSPVISSTWGKGNAGDINIDVNETVAFDGVNSFSTSGVQSNVEWGATGNGGQINITAGWLSLTNGAQVQTLVREALEPLPAGLQALFPGLDRLPGGQGKGGTININVRNAVTIDGVYFDETNGLFPSSLGSVLQFGATGSGGDINVQARSLSLTNGALLISSTFGQGNAGNITVKVNDVIAIDGDNGANILPNFFTSAIASTVEGGGVGNAGTIELNADSLSLTRGGTISTSVLGEYQSRDGKIRPAGQGNAGTIEFNAREITIDGITVDPSGTTLSSGVFSSLDRGTIGTAGNITIQTESLFMTNGAEILADTEGEGKAGTIQIDASKIVDLSGISTTGISSGLFTSTGQGANGQGGDIVIHSPVFRLIDGAVVNASTFNLRDGGNITINTDIFEAVNGGQILTLTRSNGRAGNITIDSTDRITIVGSDPNFAERIAKFGQEGISTKGAASGLFASTENGSTGQGGDIAIATGQLILQDGALLTSRSEGEGNAGQIAIDVRDPLQANNGEISTNSSQATGGQIAITAKDIRLRGDSDIRTNVNSGAGGGGDLTLTADSIIAFDDSDILAFARDGKGGNITLDTPVFFGERFQSAPEGTVPETLDGNARVDINASGAVAGVITLPDLTFIQNSLAELPENIINTENLIANSCVVPNRRQAGTFIITGSGGLPARPGDASVSTYPTGTVRTVPNDNSSSRSWKLGDPIVEPQGVYRLPSGQIVMSRECD